MNLEDKKKKIKSIHQSNELQFLDFKLRPGVSIFHKKKERKENLL
jgi:hypothetical protein